MSPALNGGSAIRRFEGSDVIEIRDGITFDFSMALPHVYFIRMEDNLLDILSLVQITAVNGYFLQS